MSILSILGARSPSKDTASRSELDAYTYAAIDLAVDSLTRAHASSDEVAATIRQILADHQERP